MTGSSSTSHGGIIVAHPARNRRVVTWPRAARRHSAVTGIGGEEHVRHTTRVASKTPSPAGRSGGECRGAPHNHRRHHGDRSSWRDGEEGTAGGGARALSRS